MDTREKFAWLQELKLTWQMLLLLEGQIRYEDDDLKFKIGALKAAYTNKEIPELAIRLKARDLLEEVLKD